ncbi:MAG: glycosyltransferase family 2 protein [Armatimonadota bacterium]
MVDLTVIIVSWNAKTYLQLCLDSLADCVANGTCNIVVVDNASEDGSAELVAAEYPGVVIIRARENLGFAKANNLALASVTSPYVLLLNSDTIVTAKAIDTMIQAMKDNPSFAVLACQHIDGTGAATNVFGSFPSLKREFSTMTGAFKWPIVRWLISMRRAGLMRRHMPDPCTVEVGTGVDSIAPVIVPVDWVNGACMMLRREVGGLDERFFFYGEDIDICMRAWNAGCKVGYLPSVTIVHYGGGSTGSNYMRLLRQSMIAQCQLFDKHYGRKSLWGLKTIYVLAGCLSVLKWSVLGAVASRHRKTAVAWIKFWTESISFLFTGK